MWAGLRMRDRGSRHRRRHQFVPASRVSRSTSFSISQSPSCARWCLRTAAPRRERTSSPSHSCRSHADDADARWNRYYRCSTNRTKGEGVCSNKTNIREDVARPALLDAIRERLLSPDGVAHMRKTIAAELRDYSKNLETDLRERRERPHR